MDSGSASVVVRCNVYFDGFNFYYGCFRNPDRPHWVHYRWLDLAKFCAKVLPDYQVVRIRYFTARVTPPADNPDQLRRQLTYFRALATIPNLTIHEGRFATTAETRHLADPSSRKAKPLLPLEQVRVIQQEEKGSDVNLATHLLVDAFRGEYDVAVVVSNDSDLAEPIRPARSELGVKVALLNPRKRFAQDLRTIADRNESVREWHLREAQFPDVLHDEHGTITKPTTW